MENKELLEKIIESGRDKVIFDASLTKRLEMLKGLKNKLLLLINGTSSKIDLEEKEREFLEENDRLSQEFKKRLKIILTNDLDRFDRNDINSIFAYILQSIKLDEEIEKLDIERRKQEEEREKWDVLKEVVSREHYLENDSYKKIFALLQEDVLRGSITINDYMDLAMYLTKKISLQLEEVIDQEEEVSSVENEHSIHEELVRIFDEEVNGIKYDFMELSDKNRDFLDKYSDVDFVRYAIYQFKLLGLNFPSIEREQDNVADILVGGSKKSLDNIIAMIRGHIELDTDSRLFMNNLLSMPEVFLDEGKFYVTLEMRHSNGKQRRKNAKKVRMSGRNASFLENINLYEELFGKKIGPLSFRDGKVKAIFWTTKSKTIKKNLDILKSYGLVDRDNFPDTVTSLVGASTEYLIDRYIELGREFYQYIKNGGSSYLSRYLYGGLTFYKIKRAIFNKDTSYRGSKRGISHQFSRSDSYDGISYDSTNGRIVQKNFSNMSDDEFELLCHYFEYPNLMDDNGCMHKVESEEYLLAELIKRKEQSEQFSDYEHYANDEFIKLLDSKYQYDEHTYLFGFDDDGRRSRVYISRPKVIRNMAFLKEEGQWLNSGLGRKEAISRMKASILSHSILSVDEYDKMTVAIEKLESVPEVSVGRSK